MLWLLLAGVPGVRAQDSTGVRVAGRDITLRIGGTLQPRFSYGRIGLGPAGGARGRTGFGVRRARLRFEALLPGRAGVSLQLGAAAPATQLFDAVLFFDVTEALRLRAGRFTPAQPRAFQGTSHTRIDLVDRVVVAQRWGNTTLANDGRDFGAEVLYETDRFDLQAGLYNGDGSWGRALGNLRSDIAEDPTNGVDTPGLSVGAYGAWRPAALPGVEVGGYGGYNGGSNDATRPPEALRPAADGFDRTRAYASYAGHLYWGARPGSQRLRLKADLLTTRYETLAAGGEELAQHTLGATLTSAVGLFDQSAELLARLERYDPSTGRDGDAEGYLSAGASLSLSALRGRPYRRQRVTFSYAARLDDDRHLAMIQAQIVF